MARTPFCSQVLSSCHSERSEESRLLPLPSREEETIEILLSGLALISLSPWSEAVGSRIRDSTAFGLQNDTEKQREAES